VPTRPEHKIFAHEKGVLCVAFNNTGNIVATGGGDNCVKIWDTEHGSEIYSINNAFSKSVNAIAFSNQ
jgi:WD40 repeat protein